MAAPTFPMVAMNRGIPTYRGAGRGEYQGVDDGEELAVIRLRADVAVADGCHDGDGEQQNIWEGPFVAPSLHLSIIALGLSSFHELPNVQSEVPLHLSMEPEWEYVDVGS